MPKTTIFTLNARGTEVSQDTWIYFPWDTGLAFVPPIREGGE
jgi:hypothetical protein